MIKLNLGCGAVRPNGWINTDSSLNANIQKMSLIGKRITRLFNPVEYHGNNVHYMNLNKRWKYKDGSIDIVYASHLFEHLTLKSANLLLKEAFRCLKAGGVMRLVVPVYIRLQKNIYVNMSQILRKLIQLNLLCGQLICTEKGNMEM